jgi:hypothetical protein
MISKCLFLVYLKMSIYVLIGFDFDRELIFNDEDRVTVDEIFLLSNTKFTTEDPKVKIVGDVNALDFYSINNLESLEKQVVFLDCRGKYTNTYLDMMYFLGTTRFENRTYYASREVKNGPINIADYPPISHFNPFEGQALSKTLSNAEITAVRQMYRNMAQILRQYLKMGFLENRIMGVPDGWMMNIHNFELELLTNYYGLVPIAKDVPKILEFLHNSQYREVVTKCLLRVVVNYAVRNGIFQSEDESKYFDYKFWDLEKMKF